MKVYVLSMDYDGDWYEPVDMGIFDYISTAKDFAEKHRIRQGWDIHGWIANNNSTVLYAKDENGVQHYLIREMPILTSADL